MLQQEKTPSERGGAVRYIAVSAVHCAEEVGIYNSYDIVAVDGEGAVVVRVDDVTADRHLADSMAERFNRCGLSPVQLKDAVLDLLP